MLYTRVFGVPRVPRPGIIHIIAGQVFAPWGQSDASLAVSSLTSWVFGCRRFVPVWLLHFSTSWLSQVALWGFPSHNNLGPALGARMPSVLMISRVMSS